MNVTNLIPRDTNSVSPWQQQPAVLEQQSVIYESTIYDVVIIGAGITGLTTGLMLQEQGKKCIILDGHSVGFGTTGGTTAHINTFFDTAYDQVEQDFGKDGAKVLADSAKESIAIIQEMVEKYGINCDFSFKDGIIFSENDKESKSLLSLLEASRRAGVEAVEIRDNGIPVPFQLAVVFNDQAEFHPMKYCLGLAAVFQSLGGVIVENAFVRKVTTEGAIQIAHTDMFDVKGRNLIYATHMPPGLTVFDVECAPYRSYVIGVKLKNSDYPKVMAYDMKDPYHYIRTHLIDDQPYLIVGGEDHKTGHEDPQAAFQDLEEYVRKYYYVESVDYKWSSQYYIPVDGLPFIGKMPGFEDNVFVATGFSGNGMILGTISGKVLSDAILEKENAYLELFSPSRIKPVAGFKDFVSENADVAYHFVADRLSTEQLKSLNDMPADYGEVVEYNGNKVAVYKDADGVISALSPTCTHAGCIVSFNAAEKSWDCPCHGGRYDLNGKVISGPPVINLKRIDELDK
jgi:glycine/D-amino acid oxidase-like deaminating enzyme/nitrite reductase/ring-hydroxylating ferredoxin subunit